MSTKNNDLANDLTVKELSKEDIIRRLKIADSPYESLFDTITRAISEICNTPIALISLVENDRQWFKSKVGLEQITEIPIETSFCAHAILSDEVMEVKDATVDKRFQYNSLVTGDSHIRFYAGAPITLPLGERIGSLCVLDTKANELSEDNKAALKGFAKVISQTLLIRDLHTRHSSKR